MFFFGIIQFCNIKLAFNQILRLSLYSFFYKNLEKEFSPTHKSGYGWLDLSDLTVKILRDLDHWIAVSNDPNPLLRT